MTKRLVVIAVLVLFTCCLCVGALGEGSKDAQFVESLSQGLTDHFTLIKEDMEAAQAAAKGKKVLRYFTPEMWTKYLMAEHDRLIDYKGAAFEAPDLAEMAALYIEGLEKHLEEVKPLTETTHEFDQYVREGFHKQCEALYRINEIYPITVAEELLSDLHAMLANGSVIVRVNEMLDLVSFQNIATLFDGRDRYEAIVINGTGLHFEEFSFEVEQYGADDKLTSVKMLGVEDWKPGEKEYFNFVADKGVVRLQVKNAYWMFPNGAPPVYEAPEAAE